MPITKAEIDAITDVLDNHGLDDYVITPIVAERCAEAAAAARECERHLPARDGWPGPQARA